MTSDEAVPGVPEDRIRRLNGVPPREGRYVLYWMQQAQRAEANLALDYAIARANRAGLGVLVLFALTPSYPEATRRAYAFMIEGLREAAETLSRRGLGFRVVLGDPPEVALLAASGASLVICDRGYLAHPRAWRQEVAKRAPCPVVEIETDLVVPLEAASGKPEYAARTIRPKILRRIGGQPVPGDAPRPDRAPPRWPPGLERYDLRHFPAGLKLDDAAGPVPDHFRGGLSEARRRLDAFLGEDLRHYIERGKRPDAPAVSGLSPYLHFGQIAPLEVLARVREARAGEAVREAFIEQLCVRRELSANFTAWTEGYDRYETAVPDWARKTLATRAGDPRPHLYDGSALEEARTHDPYWNAMMRRMRETGYLHNHLRMYWGKKVLEWSASPEEAFATLLRLNNRWFLDGCDPNSYAGVAWIFGRHDRPWAGRPIYGTVRCMTAGGLERAFDVRAWSREGESPRNPALRC